MLAIHSMQLQKEVKSNPKQPKLCGSEESHCEKWCEIWGGGQEIHVAIMAG